MRVQPSSVTACAPRTISEAAQHSDSAGGERHYQDQFINLIRRLMACQARDFTGDEGRGP